MSNFLKEHNGGFPQEKINVEDPKEMHPNSFLVVEQWWFKIFFNFSVYSKFLCYNHGKTNFKVHS